MFNVFCSITASVARAPRALCTHQLARVPLFRLLSLAVRFISHAEFCSSRLGADLSHTADVANGADVATGGSSDGAPLPICLLYTSPSPRD